MTEEIPEVCDFCGKDVSQMSYRVLNKSLTICNRCFEKDRRKRV